MDTEESDAKVPSTEKDKPNGDKHNDDKSEPVKEKATADIKTEDEIKKEPAEGASEEVPLVNGNVSDEEMKDGAVSYCNHAHYHICVWQSLYSYHFVYILLLVSVSCIFLIFFL